MFHNSDVAGLDQVVVAPDGRAARDDSKDAKAVEQRNRQRGWRRIVVRTGKKAVTTFQYASQSVPNVIGSRDATIRLRQKKPRAAWAMV